jgi:peroxiredoxin
MNSLYKDFKSNGLEIIGVNLDEDASAAKEFLSSTAAKFTILRDTSGSCPQEFGVKAMPTSYLIDRSGVVRHIHMGFKPSEAAELRSKIESLLKAGGSGGETKL